MSSSSFDQDGFETPKKQRKSSAGRKLVRWNPDLDQLTLLAVDNVCVKYGVAIPWDAVAREVEGHLTGEAIKQHLVKVHKFRELHGKKVPAKLGRNERRKVAATAPSLVTPASTGRGRKRKAISEDDDDGEVKVPGASLLYLTEKEKKKVAKKELAVTPNTIRPGLGRCKKQVKDEEVMELSIKAEDDSDEDFTARAKKTNIGGSKRGRSAKTKQDIDLGSPKKKQKKSGKKEVEMLESVEDMRQLRAREAIDYSGMDPESGDEEDDLNAKEEYDVPYEEDEDEAKVSLTRTETSSSQASGGHRHTEALFGGQGYTPNPTPNHSSSSFLPLTPYDQSPMGETYGSSFPSFHAINQAPIVLPNYEAPFPLPALYGRNNFCSYDSYEHGLVEDSVGNGGDMYAHGMTNHFTMPVLANQNIYQGSNSMSTFVNGEDSDSNHVNQFIGLGALQPNSDTINGINNGYTRAHVADEDVADTHERIGLKVDDDPVLGDQARKTTSPSDYMNNSNFDDSFQADIAPATHGFNVRENKNVSFDSTQTNIDNYNLNPEEW